MSQRAMSIPLIAWIAIAAAADVDHAPVHPVPEPLDVERVLADERVAQPRGDGVRAALVHERLDGLRGGVDLADPGDPLVGVNQDDQVVLAPVGDPLVQGCLPEDDCLHVGDLHALAPPGGRKWDAAGTPRQRLWTIAKLSTIQ